MLLPMTSVVHDNLRPEAGSEDWRGEMGSAVSDWVAPQAPGFIHLQPRRLSLLVPVSTYLPSKDKTLPKAQQTRGLSSGHQSNLFRPYHKFSNKSLSDFIFSTIFSTKQQLQNLNQISALRLNLNFKILTKRSFRMSTKDNLHNLKQGSAAKY